MQSIEQAFAQTHTRIDAALAKAGRPPKSAQLLAVSKTKPAHMIETLAGLGQRAFGENYVSEGIEKIQALASLPLEWHFIGPIQSNKTRAIASAFDWVHSVDRIKLITRLAEQRPTDLPPLNVLIQVNLDGETQKAGCAPEDIEALAEAIDQAPSLCLRGLMAIPAPRTEYADQLAVFERLKHLYDQLKLKHPSVDTLSAGMSDDLEAAIAAGATLVRIGSALFGPRASA